MLINKTYVLNYLKEKKEEINNNLGINLVAIFGSVARDEATSSSDIDILYSTKKGTLNIHDNKIQLKKELKNKFGVNIDLASMKYIKPYAKDIIQKELVYV